jgi:hypothetical protein
MSCTDYHKLYAELSRGKKRRGVLNPCAGCLQPTAKPYMVASFASESKPLNIDYILCRSCGKEVQNPRKRKRMAERVEENLEALGAFVLDLKRGEA